MAGRGRQAGYHQRRSTYFAFQGLLMAVLLLIFLTQHLEVSSWVGRFTFLIAALAATLALLRLVPPFVLGRWWFQVGLFLFDAGIASVTLHWAQARSELYLIYMLVIFGTALTRSVGRSLVIAAVTSVLYLGAAWDPLAGVPTDLSFWTRFMFLWVMSALLAILSRDSEHVRSFEERKLRDQLVEAERLSSLGQLSAEVAHRIKGPLTTIMVNAELLGQRFASSPAIAKDLRQIQEEARRCKEILKNLLDLGRIEEMDSVSVDLREPVASAVLALEAQARKKGVEVDVGDMPEAAPVTGDPSLLHEAIAAVLQNALDAVRKGGRVKVRLRARRPALEWALTGRGLRYAVEIEDDGRGITPEVLSSIFRPFYTTKKAGGSGLGLSAALRILQKHDGTIEAQSEGTGCGAMFTLTLPQRPPA
ncbi:MAG: hypothetical protein HY927_11270 [Elusimicrobia bacterium]|nr:hypothetical protein [Elusimicrobiota bacterium]